MSEIRIPVNPGFFLVYCIKDHYLEFASAGPVMLSFKIAFKGL